LVRGSEIFGFAFALGTWANVQRWSCPVAQDWNMPTPQSQQTTRFSLVPC